MRRIASIVLVGLALGLAASECPAQRPEDVFQRSLFFERDVRARLEAVTPTEQKALVEWGGFYIPSYTYFTDLGGNGGNVTVQDLRLWTQIRIDEVHRVFARLRLNYVDFAAGDAQGLRQHDLVGPNLEIGYYELDVAKAAEKYAGQTWPIGLLVRGGRQYIEVGRGIAVGKVLDVGSFDLQTKDLGFMGFAGRTPPGENNIDRGHPDWSHSRRYFYGGQLTYRSLDRHEPYAFFVFQKDDSPEWPDIPAQDYMYDSQYYGVGSRGSLTTDLQYAVESLWEFGRGSPNGTEGTREKIRGYAFDSELDYYLRTAMKPVLLLQYAYASGDGDRTSAVSAQGGNRAGTVDTEFQGFGYVNSGLALGARFANLQFLRLAGRVTPYEAKTRGGRIDVGADYYFHWKADPSGPISDTRATKNSAELGQEVDLYLEWRIFSDLSFTIRYGRFFPGPAYPGGSDPNDFLYTALNFSF